MAYCCPDNSCEVSYNSELKEYFESQSEPPTNTGRLIGGRLRQVEASLGGSDLLLHIPIPNQQVIHQRSMTSKHTATDLSRSV